MSSSVITKGSGSSGGKILWIGAAILVMGIVAWRVGWLPVAGGKSAAEDRSALYAKSVDAGAKLVATWPKTAPELLESFWKAIAARDLDQVVLYCPGSKKEDFSAYLKMSTTDKVEVGKPEQHPSARGVTLWPLKVNFAGYGAKTIKLAITTLADGRIAIDGRNSIWW